MEAFKQIALKAWADYRPYCIGFMAGLIVGVLL